MSRGIIILILSFCAVSSFAQVLNVDSLKNIDSVANNGSITEAEGLRHLSELYIYNKPDSGIYFANYALKLSKKLHYGKGEARAYIDLSQAYGVLGDYAQTMQYSLQALNVYQHINRPIGVSTMKYYIAGIYTEVGDYRQALQYYFDARKMDEENPDDLRLMFPHLSMNLRLMMCDINIADAYLTGNMLDSALFFAKRGFSNYRVLRYDWSYPPLVLGNIYLKRNQFDSALYCFRYRLTYKITGQNDRIDINNGIATIFRKQNQPDSCHYYAKMAFDTAQIIRYRKGSMRAAGLLSWVYEKTNPGKAIMYYKISEALKDSLYNQEKISRVGFLVFNERLKEQELQASLVKYQNRLGIYALLVVIACFLLIVIFLLYNKQHRQKAYALLQKQERETDRQKAKAESALVELKFTQAQLIQSLQQQASDLETQALRAQMNPHFIFNSLNSINRFILQNNKAEATEYLTKFSRLIRMILNGSASATVSLSEDLRALQLYLELECLRFDSGFSYKITCDSEIDADFVRVPPMLLQPFVENAIWHGLMNKEGEGHLWVNIDQEAATLICTIADNGIGRKKAAERKGKSALQQKSMGMNITESRIAIMNKLNGENKSVEIRDLVDADGNGAGTEVIIKIPLTYD
jgi:sensor histidine kinase YesM